MHEMDLASQSSRCCATPHTRTQIHPQIHHLQLSILFIAQRRIGKLSKQEATSSTSSPISTCRDGCGCQDDIASNICGEYKNKKQKRKERKGKRCRCRIDFSITGLKAMTHNITGINKWSPALKLNWLHSVCVQTLVQEGVRGPNTASSGVLNYEFVENWQGRKVHSWLK